MILRYLDGVNDLTDDGSAFLDLCHLGEVNWRSTPTTDVAGDACRDATEDKDIGNNGILDINE